MNVIKGNKFVYFDVDETLVKWSYDRYEADKAILFEIDMISEYLVPHSKHIELLKRYKTRTKDTVIVVWSQGGWDWAETVVKTLGLEEYVDAILTKPDIYVDDLNSVWFMGDNKRVFLEDNNGKN